MKIEMSTTNTLIQNLVIMAVICKPIGNLEKNEYWEVFTKKKHIRPNNVQNKKRNYDLFGWINIPDHCIS